MNSKCDSHPAGENVKSTVTLENCLAVSYKSILYYSASPPTRETAKHVHRKACNIKMKTHKNDLFKGVLLAIAEM